MNIKLSRHARNNMRLYGIHESDIAEAIKFPDSHKREDAKTIVLKSFQNRFSGFPLKVVYQSNGEVLIITTYPLKKAYRR